MKKRKLEEILEECLTAYLDQGRSVEESLRLHSAYRGQLEPLLRTAVELSLTFDPISPPDHVQERGLARFLSDARARQRLRSLSDETKPGWIAGLLRPQRSIGLAAGAAVVAVVAVVVAAGAMSGGSGGGDNRQVENPSRAATPSDAPETPVFVVNLQSQVDAIRQRIANRETVTSDDIRELSRAARNLTNENIDDSALPEVTRALLEADEILTAVAAQPDTASDQEKQNAVTEAQETTRAVAGIVMGTPTPPATTGATPVAGQTDAPTPATTDGATPTPAPTAAPTETAAPITDVPAPSESPVERGIPALN